MGRNYSSIIYDKKVEQGLGVGGEGGAGVVARGGPAPTIWKVGVLKYTWTPHFLWVHISGFAPKHFPLKYVNPNRFMCNFSKLKLG